MNQITATSRSLIAQGKPIIDLTTANPIECGFQFPFELLEKEYRKYFQHQFYHPDPKGDILARKAIKDFYAAKNWEIDEASILLTAGTSESYLHLFTLLAQPGDHILAPLPAYPLFDHLASQARISLRHYPLDETNGWKIDLDALEQAIDHHTRAIILISPHNPTGAVHTEDELRDIATLAAAHRLPLMCDEVFCDFLFTGHPYPRLATIADRLLVFTLNGLSKMLALPSLKLGWMVVSGEPSRVVHVVDKLETQIDALLTTHTPIQQALPAILREGRSFQKSYTDEVRRRRDLALALIATSPHLTCHPPQGGFHLMLEVKTPKPMDEEELVIRLMKEAGVFVHPGFFYDWEQGTHLVMSFLSPPERLETGLQALIRFLERVSS